MDITVTNDYTKDSMLKGCDEVIDMINKLFGTQEVSKNFRKSASDLLEELESSRIEKGSTRVEYLELFKSRTEEDIEK